MQLREPAHGGGEDAIFRREGEYWTIGFAGVVVRLRDATGLRYLDHLLRHPGQMFHVVELTRVTGGAGPRRPERDEADRTERARKAVTNRIRQTVTRIRAANELLGLHLDNAVHTGVRCGYTPDRPIPWEQAPGETPVAAPDVQGTCAPRSGGSAAATAGRSR